LKYASTSIASKWKKTGWMLRDSRLHPYVPETRLFNRHNLEAMLGRYRVVYFKPSRGTGGNRILRIERPSAGGYRIRGIGDGRRSASINGLLVRLKAYAKNRTYLLQKGIDLALTKGQPFDVRVMVQKTNGGVWKTTSLFTKIGKKGKVVTNYSRGGKVGRLGDTLRGAGYSESGIRKASSRLSRLGTDAGRCFDRHRKGFRELGLDVAIDKRDRYWILETNTRPQYYPLKLVDKAAYRRVSEYARAYGRGKKT